MKKGKTKSPHEKEKFLTTVDQVVKNYAEKDIKGDLSDTTRECRIGTAKFFTLLLLLYRTSAKSQGMKQLMAGGGVALIGTTLVPLLSGLFG